MEYIAVDPKQGLLLSCKKAYIWKIEGGTIALIKKISARIGCQVGDKVILDAFFLLLQKL